MIEVTLKYGLTRQLTVDVADGTTIAQLAGNANYRASLGFPENVSATINGDTIDMNETVADGDVILFEKQAAAKAA